ncbi:gluconate 2-dehydrogenase subunit 3 family protein [Candidimonas humi]|uniref:Gluconate 2-dehydrogenase subunit 3 family protein n=1 Tax=Candidimonas humi TaxID=683355 RepID=A0ABV8P5X3_9BURK|nr:gluconate 2-dehydrogenase subunit 3 family protein [Candidimonas humi]MBV6307243.1 gluconate 2-dehydrogenase subunit 3 family protein [Candidimonas humi]
MDEFKESRRTFLRGTVIGGTAAASVALPLAGLAQQAANTAAPPGPAPAPAAAEVPAGYVFLTPEEQAFVETLVDHMSPADGDFPGGMDLGLHTFIDRALAQDWGKGDRLYTNGPWKQGTPNQGYQLPMTPAQLARTGIRTANAACTEKYGKSFDQLTEAQREEVLKSLQAGSMELKDGPPSKEFFALLLQMVVEGTFADPIYGGNKDKAAWKAIGFPGVVATHALDIVNYRNKPYPTKPLSIADLA